MLFTPLQAAVYKGVSLVPEDVMHSMTPVDGRLRHGFQRVVQNKVRFWNDVVSW